MASEILNEDLSSSGKEVEDRISQLPDDILHQILSFFPTNFAISTCLLSTRWKNVWMGVSTLHFDDMQYFSNVSKNQIKFFNFVYKAFLIRDSNVVNKLILSCEIPLQSSWLDKWISCLLRRKIEDISIKACTYTTNNHFLHLDLLNRKSLKIKTSSFIKFPSSVSFSRLKVLHLYGVGVTCNEKIQKVCVSCPVLEELDLHCLWMNIKAVIFLVPTLKKLTIYMYNIKENDKDLEIKFLAECLESLHVTTHTPYKLSLSNLLSLREALLNIDTDVYWRDAHKCVSIVLEAISCVHHLTLFHFTIQKLLECGLLVKLRALSSLKSLIIVMSRDGVLDGDHFRELFGYLPNIEALVFKGGLPDSDYYYRYDYDGEIGETYGWKVESAPQPSLPNLKSVALYNVYGNKKELGLVKFLLKNASALEKITITSSSDLFRDLEKHLEFSKQLLPPSVFVSPL
ncbi:hypothetical protein ACHQM5_003616 [Ranunculus cassubicifolius]